MKQLLTMARNKLGLTLGIAVATMVGGVGGAIVMASVPDSSGVIHACYSTGILGKTRIIDSATTSCNNNETAITWNQQGPKGDTGATGPQGPAGASGAPVLHDANGQILGNLLDATGGVNGLFGVFNQTVNRVIPINFTGFEARRYVFGYTGAPLFQSNDCSGQAYESYGPTITLKINLLKINNDSYGIIQDNASAQTITYRSIRSYDSDTDTFSCNPVGPINASNLYPVTPVALPFTTPIAEPFKL